MNREIEYLFPPLGVVSLVPSQTELLYYLGLDKEVVGQTLFCIHPASQHLSKPRVGGTKKLSIDKIKELNPDLIIGNKEENSKEQIEELERFFPVWMSNVKTFDEALDMIAKLGSIVSRISDAHKLVKQLTERFEKLEKDLAGKEKLKAAYLIWDNPRMAAGRNTFIDDMLNRAGFENVVTNEDERYPLIDKDKLQETDWILLSSEPFPFEKKHLEDLKRQFPQKEIRLVDGELFSWYGSRMLKAPEYFWSLRK